jgi:hypothetical protein
MIMQTLLKAFLAMASLAIFFSINVTAEDIDSIPITCYKIPENTVQLCTVETNSSFGPVNDVVFYKRDQEGLLTYLRAQKAEVAVIFIAGFSTGGKLTIIGEADEGHPSFIIYKTKALLDSERSAQPVGILSDYYLREITKLADNGVATVLKSFCNDNDIPLLAAELPPGLVTQLDIEECYVAVSIF